MSTSTIKARIQLGDHGVATVRTLIAHPMLIDRTDPKTGARLPAHFIEDVEITLNGIPAISLEWGQAVSTNPLVAFELHGVKRGDVLGIRWKDNQGKTDAGEFPVV
ncbi:MAG: thiosulfate oxidation carrier complex protein SoxZ [Rhodocyclaceae bacterium]|jgi:sulfur-oxidizing protein SoxZ|nr:thiosulfate oxidation carrier complex protein SoxZ [Rhodocyclaceae bacterium]